MSKKRNEENLLKDNKKTSCSTDVKAKEYLNKESDCICSFLLTSLYEIFQSGARLDIDFLVYFFYYA